MSLWVKMDKVLGVGEAHLAPTLAGAGCASGNVHWPFNISGRAR
jgi:hypothetical protein